MSAECRSSTVMMFAGFLFLLLFTGGSTNNHTELPDGEGFSNQSHFDIESGSTNNHTELPDGEGVYNESYMDVGGNTNNHTEPPDGESVYNQSGLDRGSTNEHTVPSEHWSTGRGDQPANCTYAYMINKFNLTDKVKFYMSRPTKNSRRSTNVTLSIYLYSILDVKEKEQELVSYFWIEMRWINEFISWDLNDFCWIPSLTVPSELLWKPDLTIEEVTRKDSLFQTSYIKLAYFGLTRLKNGIVLVTTCKMQFYRFPFDSQTCSLTFKPVQHIVWEIELQTGLSNEEILNHTRHLMKTESEWFLMNVTVETQRVYNFKDFLSVLIYTMTIKRRSVLYVANFIVPILFFLCLDLASFLISESGGEKLSFKVTVLLAVTVMQLILNDILPSSSDRIPLIAVYCIGVFTLMMLSLLETILMMYLMEKDDVSQDKEADKDQNLCDNCRDQGAKVQNCFRGGINKSIPCVRIFDDPPAVTTAELLPEVKEGSSSQLTEEIPDFESLTDELKDISKKISLLLNSRKEEKEPGYWTRMTKKLNRIYFIFYIITASVFLITVFSIWLID